LGHRWPLRQRSFRRQWQSELVEPPHGGQRAGSRRSEPGTGSPGWVMGAASEAGRRFTVFGRIQLPLRAERYTADHQHAFAPGLTGQAGSRCCCA
jgi:hypothetical protein